MLSYQKLQASGAPADADAVYLLKSMGATFDLMERFVVIAIRAHIEIIELLKTSTRAPGGPRRRWLALGQPSVQFRWLVVLALSLEWCVDA